MGLNRLVGDPKAKFLYPRIAYSTQTMDFVIPAMNYAPLITAMRGVNMTVDGHMETLWNRNEEVAQLDLVCEPEQVQRLRWFFMDHAGRGAQFRLWVDRFTGSCWAFEDTRRDQNGLTLTFNGGGTETYGDYHSLVPGHRGIVLSGAQYLSVATAQASAGTPTGYDDPLERTEGILNVEFRPTFAGNDSALHHIIDTSGTTANRLMLYKTAANALTFEIRDAAAGVKSKAASVSWSANERVHIIASWTTAGVLTAWYSLAGGAFTELTTAAGAGTGLITTLGTTLYIGAENDATDLALGTYDKVAFFKRAFSNPLLLFDETPVERNHYPYAELIAPSYQPQVYTYGNPARRWPLTVRNGVAA